VPRSLAGSHPADAPHPRALVRRVALVMALVLFGMGTFGSNIGPAWVDTRPVLTLILSSRNRNLFGSVPYIDPLPYAIIGFVRILVAGVVLFLLGRWYGRKAIDWTEGQIGEMPAIYRWFQNGVDRAGWAMVLFMPGSNFVCLMAGHRHWDLRRFVSLLSVGIALKLVVLWIGGQIFDDEIRWFLDAIEQYQWWIVGGLFALSFVQMFGRVRTALPEVIEEIEHPHVHDGSAGADEVAGPGPEGSDDPVRGG
jgi:membrane protein DedA with SNARE-associated domain